MSRNYKKWQQAAWDEEPFRSLSKAPPNAQTLYLQLMIGPHTVPLPGVGRAGLGALADTLGWSPGDVERTFAELAACGAAMADWSARVTYVPGGLYHDPPDNQNSVKFFRRTFVDLPRCAVTEAIDANLRAFLLIQDRDRQLVDKKSGALIEHGWIRAWDPTYKPSSNPTGTVAEPSANPHQGLGGTLPNPVTFAFTVASTSPVASTVPAAAAVPDSDAFAFEALERAYGKVGGPGEGNRDAEPASQRKAAKCKCGSEVYIQPTGDPGEYFEADGSLHVLTAACKKFRIQPRKEAVAS